MFLDATPWQNLGQNLYEGKKECYFFTLLLYTSMPVSRFCFIHLDPVVLVAFLFDLMSYILLFGIV